MVPLGRIVGVLVPQGQELADAMLVPEVVERLAAKELLLGVADHSGGMQLV